MKDKYIVFVIMPFEESHLDLYEHLKATFSDDFEFTNGGDLDNQQNILQDIVEGIYNADVVIADLTGLNPNVFYEMGLAHAMNKSVIILTQNISDLPFDIKSYRANEYSLQFNKLPLLESELKKLLYGAIDGRVKYGNPLFDYYPDFDPKPDNQIVPECTRDKKDTVKSIDNAEIFEAEDCDKGFLDYLADIDEKSNEMTEEIEAISFGLDDVVKSLDEANIEIDQVAESNKNIDPRFAQKICKKLAQPINDYSGSLKVHVDKVVECWDIIENCYLEVLESPFVQTTENIRAVKESKEPLEELKSIIAKSDESIEMFVESLEGIIGIERKLTKSTNSLITELNGYLSMTEKISSSVDRIISKSERVVKQYEMLTTS